ncbi:unnamed protein product [Gongylonema pulchrum]|uniref:ARID domain-containing protein n=1 Tax=Gongylonema pulchrum TaxID=637853 RepID=A0A183DPP5_9BILA|nr:unnamed protein product [Gongylonema pulchrum]
MDEECSYRKDAEGIWDVEEEESCTLQAPHVQGAEVDLCALYEAVVALGGWQKVSLLEKWGDVARAIGISSGVAVAGHAVKVLYMRYLSKYEQSELVGDVDDSDSDLLSSRSRSKGFSSLATADCPISTGQRQQQSEYFRLRPEKREAEYDRIVKSLLCGLPNEVDFAVNVCTLLSHPGPRVLRVAAAPQIVTLLVAHLAIFPDGLCNFHITEEESNIFCGLSTEFQPRNVVSWRVQQVLSIVRNLSFEVINKADLAANWPLLNTWDYVCTDRGDVSIDLMGEEYSLTNHLLLKTVSYCLHSEDKLQIIRALEILSGLCNNDRNESLICEFLDSRILSKIFTVISVKDIMMCVYTLESLYQVCEFCGKIYPLVARPGSYTTATHSPAYQSRVTASRGTNASVTASSTPTVGDSKVEQLTAKWIRMNCVAEMGSVVPRGELYASYVDDLRHRYGALSGSVQTFTNIIKAVYPNVVLRIQQSPGSNMPVFENLRMCKTNATTGTVHGNTATVTGVAAATATSTNTSIIASHPLVQKMLTDNSSSTTTTSLNGHAAVGAVDQKYLFFCLLIQGLSSVRSHAAAVIWLAQQWHNVSPISLLYWSISELTFYSVRFEIPPNTPTVLAISSDEVTASSARPNSVHVINAQPSTSSAFSLQMPSVGTGAQHKVCRSTAEIRDILSKQRPETKIVRVENRAIAASSLIPSCDAKPGTSQVKYSLLFFVVFDLFFYQDGFLSLLCRSTFGTV